MTELRTAIHGTDPMTPASALALPAPDATGPTSGLERRKVYDPFLRLLHAWNGFAILFLVATAWLAELVEEGAGRAAVWHLHVYGGYGLTGGLVLRLIWGLFGPAHARLSDLWHPREWWQAIRRVRPDGRRRYGHDPLASAAYLIFYGLVALMVATGLGLAAVEHDMGPLARWLFDSVWLEELFEEPHELAYLFVLGFIALHIGALVRHEVHDRIPLAQSMVSGYQYRRSSADDPLHTDDSQQEDLHPQATDKETAS